MKMQYKITVTLTLLIATLILVLTGFMYWNWYTSIQKQVAMDAMDQAIIIADNEALSRDMVIDNGYIAVNNKVERIHLKTGIQYLYILNQEGRYFAHPIPEKLNTFYDVGDTLLDPFVTHPSYHYNLTTDAMVEAYAPIFTDGVRTGAVVIGIYNGRILQTLRGHAIRLLVLTVVAIALGLVIAYGLSKNIKKAMFSLEPEAISMLLHQRETILEHIGEGILATDHAGQILLMNDNAKRLLDRHDIETVQELPFYGHFISLLEREGELVEAEWRIKQDKVIKIQVISLSGYNDKLGHLFKIDDMSLVRARAEELTNMQQLMQALRAQNHEFMNKLHTISGLIQLDAHEDALQYIESISRARREIVEALNEKVRVPALSGLLLAKHSRAAEKKIDLVIDEKTDVSRIPIGALDEDMTSILGNLIDNAIDALSVAGGEINALLFQDDANFVVEISDNGAGIEETELLNCLEKGYSTKGDDRGYGLHIVSEKIKYLGGKLSLYNDNGLCCVVKLPMEREES